MIESIVPGAAASPQSGLVVIAIQIVMILHANHRGYVARDPQLLSIRRIARIGATMSSSAPPMRRLTIAIYPTVPHADIDRQEKSRKR